MKELKDLLKTGHENAIPIKNLAAMLQINERDVRQQVENLRREGFLVCNRQDSAGYYYAANVADVKRQYEQMYSRAISILTAAKPFRRFLKKAGEQVK